MTSARLIRSRWLIRELEVTLPDGPHLIRYSGWGMGYEEVIVDGDAIRQRGQYWFVPEFDFKLGGWHGVVKVRIWPWFAIRSLVLQLGEHVVYAEGLPATLGKQAGHRDDWADLV